MPDDVLVKCENVSKKFCRSLKRSLWYGVQDVCSEMNPFRGARDIVGIEHFPELRKNEFWAVNNVSFELKRGECLGLIGRNGAGKSTLLKMLNGLIKPDHGRITMKGRIGALIELNAGFNPILTGRENVYIYGSILGFSKKEIDRKYDDIVDFAELADFMEMPFRSYSSGMKVRLGFAVAVQMEPDVLIIDEVLAVGDVGFRNKCYNSIYKIAENAAVIFVSHSMNHIDRLCTKGILMSAGEKIIQGENTGLLIDKYLNLFNNNKLSTLKKNNKIENYSISVNGNSIDEKIYQEYGKPLTIEVKIKIPPVYKQIEIAVAFLDSSLNLIANSNTKLQDFSFLNNGKMKKITVNFPKYQIGSGIHYLSFSIVDSDTNEILLWDHAFASIATKYNMYIPAPVHFNGEWHEEYI